MFLKSNKIAFYFQIILNSVSSVWMTGICPTSVNRNLIIFSLTPADLPANLNNTLFFFAEDWLSNDVNQKLHYEKQAYRCLTKSSPKAHVKTATFYFAGKDLRPSLSCGRLPVSRQTIAHQQHSKLRPRRTRKPLGTAPWEVWWEEIKGSAARREPGWKQKLDGDLEKRHRPFRLFQGGYWQSPIPNLGSK